MICRAAIFSGLAALALSAQAETNELAVARQALRDGLWELARSHAAKDASDEAKLVVLESLAGEGKWNEIARTLDGWPDVRGDGFSYYRAVVKGDHAAAMDLLRKGGSFEGCVEADLYEARELAKAGRREEAEVIWRRMVAVSNVSTRVLAIVSASLMDVELLRRAYATADTASLRRMVGLRLGVVLLRDEKTAEEGEKTIRAIVKDSPDADGAREAFLAVADRAVADGKWKTAYEDYRQAVEIWPEAVKLPSVQEGRGWVLLKLGRREESLDAFRRAEKLAADDETKARVTVKQGDILQEIGRSDESMALYRTVLDKFPTTTVAVELKKVVAVRELEKKGRELYRSFKFAEASEVFAEVSKADPARRPIMDYFSLLCLYGQGRDDDACARARLLIAECASSDVRHRVMLWLAKLLYNRREWNEASRLFVSCTEGQSDADLVAEALLWASRAAYAENDFSRTIQLTTRIAEQCPECKCKPMALLLQGEALIEQARFDEAVLVLDRAAVSVGMQSDDRVRAQVLKADALYALGADNPARYVAAHEAYRAILFGGRLSPSDQIVVSFKVARVLEKLKRTDEAVDLYYAKVVLAYRENRLSGLRMNEESRAAFSRAAFRLADEYESSGRDRQAVNILRLVEESDVPAAAEAGRRINKISNKGRLL